MERTDILGYAVLFLGVALLVFTFFNAFSFLTEELGLVASGDLVKAFGEALAPLVRAAIHAIYLCVMGWVGSLVSIRGVQIITGQRREGKAEKKVEKRAEAQQQASQAEQPQSAVSG